VGGDATDDGDDSSEAMGCDGVGGMDDDEGEGWLQD